MVDKEKPAAAEKKALDKESAKKKKLSDALRKNLLRRKASDVK